MSLQRFGNETRCRTAGDAVRRPSAADQKGSHCEEARNDAFGTALRFNKPALASVVGAKSLSLDISPMLLARADETIE